MSAPVAQRLVVYGYQFLWPFSVSENGVLVAAPMLDMTSRLLWLDRTGKQVGSVGEAGFIGNLTLSPDRRRVAVDVADPNRDTAEIWIYDTASGVGTKFAFSQRTTSIRSGLRTEPASSSSPTEKRRALTRISGSSRSTVERRRSWRRPPTIDIPRTGLPTADFSLSASSGRSTGACRSGSSTWLASAE
jgi:hypothetical protein